MKTKRKQKQNEQIKKTKNKTQQKKIKNEIQKTPYVSSRPPYTSKLDI